jgi:acyl carrier protein
MDVLRLEENETPGRKDRLMELGFDSLMAVELKARLVQSLDGAVDLPSTLIFDYPTIEAISELIRSQLAGRAKNDGSDETAQTPEQRTDDAALHAEAQDREIESLSEDEVETLLLERLKGL